MMSLIDWFEKKQFNKIVGRLAANDEKFIKLRERIESVYGPGIGPLDYTGISKYFLIDMLEEVFNEGKVVLPSEIRVLDVGMGTWFYAPALLAFLSSWMGSRNVHLEGVDFPRRNHKKSVNRLSKEYDLEVHWNDVMDLDQKGRYDVIFMIHMLGGPSHCRSFKVPYRSPSLMFPQIESLGKTDSLLVIIAYIHGGESAIINCLTKKSIASETVYRPRVGTNLDNAIDGRYGFHDNRICIARSPYVDIESCKKHEEELEKWDALLDQTLGIK